MKKFNLLSLVLITFILGSCGSKEITLSVEPKLGEWSEYMSVSQQEITVNSNGDGYLIGSFTIDVKKGVQFDSFISSQLEFNLKVLNENHVVLAELNQVDLRDGVKVELTNNPYRSILTPGSYGIEFKAYAGKDDVKKVMEEGKYLQISVDEKVKFAPYDGANGAGSEASASEDMGEALSKLAEMNVSDESSSNSDNTNGDSAAKEEAEKLLDQFVKVTKDLITLTKKVKDGDDSVKMELVKKTEEYSNIVAKLPTLAKKSGDDSIMKRFEEINSDYLKQVSK